MGLPARKMDRHYTYGDYRTWPDDERWELIDGVAWNMCAAPNRRHQGLLGELYAQVAASIKKTGCRLYLAPFDVLLPESSDQGEDDVPNVVQPDLAGICDPAKLTPRGCLGAPDWVVEIISPWTMKKDLHEKFTLYERHGVREYWLIDPASRTMQVYRHEPPGRYGEALVLEENAEIACPLGEGVVVRLSELFAAGD